VHGSLQHLNLLKLPSAIVDYLADCTDPAVVSYFTERGLRPLTLAVDKADALARFSAMMSEFREKRKERGVSENRRSP